ncbi:MAG: hypothetical protein U0586_14680 [Candidatus Brocadiaceae bacterium]
MKMRKRFLLVSAVILSGVLAVNINVRGEDVKIKPTMDEFSKKTQSLQLPFIANEGQADEQMKFYANTFGGTVFVTNEGEIVYSLPKNVGRSGASPDVERRGSSLSIYSNEGRDERCDLAKGSMGAGEDGGVGAEERDNSGYGIADCGKISPQNT